TTIFSRVLYQLSYLAPVETRVLAALLQRVKRALTRAAARGDTRTGREIDRGYAARPRGLLRLLRWHRAVGGPGARPDGMRPLPALRRQRLRTLDRGARRRRGTAGPGAGAARRALGARTAHPGRAPPRVRGAVHALRVPDLPRLARRPPCDTRLRTTTPSSWRSRAREGQG